MNANDNETNKRHGNRTNRWAPLSYPSAAIFSSTSRGGGGQNISIGRAADPFFPLHRDVLIAAMREWLIVDGKIDPLTLKMTTRTETTCKSNTGTTVAVVGEKKVTNLDQQYNATSQQPRKRKVMRHMAPLSSDNERRVIIDFSLFKKRRTHDAGVDSLAIPQAQFFEGKPSHPRPYDLVSNDQDKQEEALPFDYSQFNSTEDFVDYAVNRALLAPVSAKEYDNSQSFVIEKESSDPQPDVIASARKVSDVDELDQAQCNNSDFPLHMLSFVRSNIMMLQISQSGSKLSKLVSQSDINFGPIKLANAMSRDDAIMSFLRHPKLQRQQQQGETNQTLLVLPNLLNASIEDEYNLRVKAHQMVSSLVDPFDNDLDVSLRAFLGYKLINYPSRDRLLEIISDIMFDVSHAMYAWIHTEEAFTRNQGKCDANKTKHLDMDMQIKASLFDGRALHRIGGFEPTSLLPLALGIRRCRQTKTTWEEYALSKEGRMASSVHVKQQHRPSCDDIRVGGEKSLSCSRKELIQLTTENKALLELGRNRRGRRVKSVLVWGQTMFS